MVLLSPSISRAEPFTITYNEPTANLNDCSHFNVYYCWGTTCTNWIWIARFAASDANCGQAGRTFVVDVPVPQDVLPTTLRVRVRVVNTDGNESTGVIGSKSVT